MRVRTSLVVITLVCATAATVAAQPQATPETQATETITGTKIQLPDGGSVIVFPGKGGLGQIFRTNVSCKRGTDGWSDRSCGSSKHNCSNLQDDMKRCCGSLEAVSVATCSDLVD